MPIPSPEASPGEIRPEGGGPAPDTTTEAFQLLLDHVEDAALFMLGPDGRVVMGLGLPIVQRIVGEPHGSVSVGNGPDGGAEVRVYLPGEGRPNAAPDSGGR